MSEKKKRKWLTPYTITIIISCIMAASFEYQQELKEENKVEIDFGSGLQRKELAKFEEAIARVTDKYKLVYNDDSEKWYPDFVDENGEVILASIMWAKTTEDPNIIILHNSGIEMCDVLFNMETGEEIGRYFRVYETEIKEVEESKSRVGFLYEKKDDKTDLGLYVEGEVYENPIIKDDKLRGNLIFEIRDGIAIQKFDITDHWGMIYQFAEDLPILVDGYTMSIQDGELYHELLNNKDEIIVRNITQIKITSNPYFVIFDGIWNEGDESYESVINLKTGEMMPIKYTLVLEVEVREVGTNESKIGFVGQEDTKTNQWDLYVEDKIYHNITAKPPIYEKDLAIIEVDGNKVTQISED